MMAMRTSLLLAASLMASLLTGAGRPDLGKLPDWAQASARAAAQETPPQDAEAWVLLMRRELTYLGHGTVQIRCLRLVQIIKGKGLEEAGFIQRGLREGKLRIKDLKGWNLRPDGELVKLGSKHMATFADSPEVSFDTATAAVAILPRVMEGSLVAFEVVQEFTGLRNPLNCGLLEPHPIRRWELDAAVKGPMFSSAKGVRATLRRLGFDPWIGATPEVQEERLAVASLPPLPLEDVALPGDPEILPFVEVRFSDPDWAGSQTLDSWDSLARWYHSVFAPKVVPVPPGEPALSDGLQGLQTLWRWFGRELTYKQVYLTPDRDNVPEASIEVLRKRYGDCKDLACLFIALAQRAGFEGHPALARMQDGPIRESEVSGQPRDRFDHVIVALRLKRSLGLPGEVETPAGRFLLVDPTNPLTPLGWLSDAHRDSRVLVCLGGSGQWIPIPPGAVLRGDLDIQLTGKADSSGTLVAQVLIRETGNLWGLRHRAHTLTRAQFRAHLESTRLSQALNGSCELLGLSDPLDLEHPFEVRLGLKDPRGLTMQGSDWLFKAPLGLPALPPPLTKAGKTRQFPVESRGDGRVVLHGRIELPREVRPLRPDHSGSTSFRDLSWKLSLESDLTGPALTFRVEHRRKDAAFPFGHLEKGVEAWRKDRALVRSLLEDGMALRP